MGAHDERIKGYQERRLVLLMQREQAEQALQQIERGIFACEGAMEALSALNVETPAESPPPLQAVE